MATDPVSEADTAMTDRLRWGPSGTDTAVIKVIAFLKTVRTRLQNHEDRIAALEARLPQ